MMGFPSAWRSPTTVHHVCGKRWNVTPDISPKVLSKECWSESQGWARVTFLDHSFTNARAASLGLNTIVPDFTKKRCRRRHLGWRVRV